MAKREVAKDPSLCKADQCTDLRRGKKELCPRHQRRWERNGTLDRVRAQRAGYTP